MWKEKQILTQYPPKQLYLHNEERNPKMVTIKQEEKEEFLQYFLQTVELTQKIFPHISHLRDSGDKEGFS